MGFFNALRVLVKRNNTVREQQSKNEKYVTDRSRSWSAYKDFRWEQAIYNFHPFKSQHYTISARIFRFWLYHGIDLELMKVLYLCELTWYWS